MHFRSRHVKKKIKNVANLDLALAEETEHEVNESFFEDQNDPPLLAVFEFEAMDGSSITQEALRLDRGVGTGEASEARASPEIRAFTIEKF